MHKKLSFIILSAAVMMFAACNKLEPNSGDPPADAFQITNFNTSFTLEPGERRSVGVVVRNAKGDVTVKAENDDNVKAIGITYEKGTDFSQGTLTFEATTLEAKTVDVVFIFSDGKSTFRKTLSFTITAMTPFKASFKDAELNVFYLENEYCYETYELQMEHIHGDVVMKKIAGIPDNVKVEYAYDKVEKSAHIVVVNTNKETEDKTYDATVTLSDGSFDIDVPAKFVCLKYAVQAPTCVEFLEGGATKYWPGGYKDPVSFQFHVISRSPVDDVKIKVTCNLLRSQSDGGGYFEMPYETPEECIPDAIVIAPKEELTYGDAGIGYDLQYDKETRVGTVKVWGRNKYPISPYDEKETTKIALHIIASNEGGSSDTEYLMRPYVFMPSRSAAYPVPVSEGKVITVLTPEHDLKNPTNKMTRKGGRTNNGAFYIDDVWGKPKFTVDDYCKSYVSFYWRDADENGGPLRNENGCYILDAEWEPNTTEETRTAHVTVSLESGDFSYRLKSAQWAQSGL